MKRTNDQELKTGKETYLAAMAAYTIIRTSNLAQVRRATMNTGEVKAEPIDFACDIEIRAKQTLKEHNELLLWWNVLEDPESYSDLPEYMQEVLGAAFDQFDLGIDGPYRQLYFRLKNQSDRRRMSESSDGTDTGTAEDGSDYAAGDGDYSRAEEAGTSFPQADWGTAA